MYSSISYNVSKHQKICIFHRFQNTSITQMWRHFRMSHVQFIQISDLTRLNTTNTPSWKGKKCFSLRKPTRFCKRKNDVFFQPSHHFSGSTVKIFGALCIFLRPSVLVPCKNKGTVPGRTFRLGVVFGEFPWSQKLPWACGGETAL